MTQTTPAHALEAVLIDQLASPIAGQVAPTELLVGYAPKDHQVTSGEESRGSIPPRELGRDIGTSADASGSVPMPFIADDAASNRPAVDAPPAGAPDIANAMSGSVADDASLSGRAISVAEALSPEWARRQVAGKFRPAIIEPTEDPDLLAERIGRILREEARRYGIDV